MTQEEVQKKANEKRAAIEMVCKQMQVVLTAEQVITKNGLIKNLVFYTDIEKYDIEEPKQDEEIVKKMEDFYKVSEGLLRKESEDSIRVRPSDVAGSESEKVDIDWGDINESGESVDKRIKN